MKTLEKIFLYLALGAVAPIAGFLLGWWGTMPFLSGALPFLGGVIGALAGVLLDMLFLHDWVARAYALDLKVWMGVYLFYSIGLLGMFMGVPVFNLLLAVPAGLFVGSRLAHQAASRDEVIRLCLRTSLFTSLVMLLVCIASGVIALLDPYTAGNLEGMLGLRFHVTQGMLLALILVGGTGLLLLQSLLSAGVAALTYLLYERRPDWLSPS